MKSINITGGRVRRRRIYAGIRQKRMCEILEIASQGNYSKVEHGQLTLTENQMVIFEKWWQSAKQEIIDELHRERDFVESL